MHPPSAVLHLAGVARLTYRERIRHTRHSVWPHGIVTGSNSSSRQMLHSKSAVANDAMDTLEHGSSQQSRTTGAIEQ